MSIMVKKLYKNGSFLYKMNLVAGQKGLNNLVQWVHIIEDDSATSFLHGNELVFTAGILNKTRHWLLSFAQKLHEAGTSAFVVNIGPHIDQIPEEVMQYCNDVGMPLFTIPWETRMVDMTRDFCHRIMNNEHVESNTATTIKNIIFNVGDIDTQVLAMERYGYQRDNTFCFVNIATYDSEGRDTDEHKDTVKRIAESVAKRFHELFITFSYKDSLILVLVNYKTEEVQEFIKEFISAVQQKAKGWSLHIGVSSNKMGIYDQKTNFEKALYAIETAKRRDELVNYYDKLGIYKVLYAVADKSVLREFYKNAVRKIEVYDRENGTQLVDMLKSYLENNGSLQLVSEKQFVHRNTVTNQLKKVEEITGLNPFELEDKVSFLIAFYIKEIL